MDFIKKHIIAIVCISFICFLIFQHLIERDKLKENHEVAIGKVMSFSKHPKSRGADFEYFFMVNNIKYEGTTGYESITIDAAPNFLNKTFPVVYYKFDRHNHDILITPRDFQIFGLTYPDSLNWVRKYMRHEN